MRGFAAIIAAAVLCVSCSKNAAPVDGPVFSGYELGYLYWAGYHGPYSENENYGDYTVVIANCPVTEYNGIPAPSSSDNGIMLKLGFVAGLSDYSFPFLPVGEYRVSAGNGAEFCNSNSSEAVIRNGNIASRLSFDGGTVRVLMSSDSVYVIEGDLSIKSSVLSGQSSAASFAFRYSGKIRMEFAGLPSVPGDGYIEAPVDLEFEHASCSYYGNGMSGNYFYDDFTLSLWYGDGDFSSESESSLENGYLISLPLNTILRDGLDSGMAEIPEGIYEVREREAPYTLAAGKIENMGGSFVTGTKVLRKFVHEDGSVAERYGVIKSGQVFVVRNGEDYLIYADLLTGDSVSVKGSYYGPVFPKNLWDGSVPGPVSALRKDTSYVPEGSMSGIMYYFPEYYSSYKDYCRIRLMDGGRIFADLSLLTPRKSATVPTGVFMINQSWSENSAIPGACLSGGGERMFSWMYLRDEDGNAADVPLKSGIVEISHGANGYSVNASAVDDKGNNVSFEWDGNISVEVMSAD